MMIFFCWNTQIFTCRSSYFNHTTECLESLKGRWERESERGVMREEVKRMRDDWFECTWIVSGRRSPDADPHIYRCDCSVYYSKPKNNLTAIRGRWRAVLRHSALPQSKSFGSSSLPPRSLPVPCVLQRVIAVDITWKTSDLKYKCNIHNGSPNVGNIKLKLFTAVKNNILWQKPYLN